MDQAQRPVTRPRSKSGWSFHSDKSPRKRNTIDLTESHEEKAKSHLTESTKANPNAAMNEAQPSAAALEASTMTSLSSVAHVDMYGNPIAEPDRSNPTRSRWERPLDTIRSFEEQIDSGYDRRSSQMMGGSVAPSGNGFASRRSSYYGGYDNGYQQSNRFSQYGGYNSRVRDSYGPRDSYAPRDPYAPRDSYNRRESYHQYNDYGPPVPQHRSPRGSADPYSRQQYPYQRSRDTIGGESSGSQSDPWTNSTDPSSENSSVDRHPAGPVKPPVSDLGEQYGFNGFGHDPILEENSGFGQNPYDQNSHGQNSYGQPPPRPQAGSTGYYNRGPQGNVPPPPPPHASKSTAPLGATSGNAAANLRGKLQRASSSGEKRVSWLKKRFSKG